MFRHIALFLQWCPSFYLCHGHIRASYHILLRLNTCSWGKGGNEASGTLLEAKVGVGRHHGHLMMLWCDFNMQQSKLHVAARSYINDKQWFHVLQEVFQALFFMKPRFDDPTTQFYSRHIFWRFTGFWSEQLDVNFKELTILLDRTKCRKIRCYASKNFHFFSSLGSP